MSVKETPLAQVKRLHGSKESLVDGLIKMLDAGEDESSGELKERLMVASNKKLLRLHSAAGTISSKYGGKDKLIEKLCAARGKSKDADYAASLHRLSLTRLLDMTNQRN